MKKIILCLMAYCFVLACSKEKLYEGPSFYQDDFENYVALEDLLLKDDVFFSFTQLTRPENYIIVDSSFAHRGNKSLKFSAIKSNPDQLSKCSIAKQNMAFWEGETMRVTAWYYIQGNDSLNWLFLFDIEEQTAIGAGPGMRLALVNNQLRVEYKFFEKDILQPIGQELDFPRDQWVELVWELKLSQKKKGEVRLWQNGQLLINTVNNTTLPKDILYSLQGTKGMYSSIEIGITANTRDNDLTLWVDDIRFEKLN